MFLTSLSASCANERKDKITPIIVILFKTLSTAKFEGRGEEKKECESDSFLTLEKILSYKIPMVKGTTNSNLIITND